MCNDAIHEKDWARAAILEARVCALLDLIEDVEHIKPNNLTEAKVPNISDCPSCGEFMGHGHECKRAGEYRVLAELLDTIYEQPLVPLALDAVIKARLEVKRISDNNNKEL
jgi:hypothetical protein